jgi:hypothetical protein
MDAMPDAFSLRWKLNQPYVYEDKSESIYALLTIEPNPAVLGNLGSDTALPAHLIVLVDVSASMDYLMRPDPDAKIVGEVLTEGRTARSVESKVPSRREVACEVTQRLASRLGGDDLLTLVAFDDQAHVLANGVPAGARDKLREAIHQLADVGGGGTSLGRGLQAVRKYLAAPGQAQQQTRKLIVLTDGEDQEPDSALFEAQHVGRDHGVPIIAFGTGECKIAFLTDLAKTTLSGAFNHIRNEGDAEQFFHKVLSNQKNVQATSVVLHLWLSPEVHVSELYRTRPEILYVGDMEPDADNVVQLRLEQMEKGKAYEFLFRCSVPRRSAGQRFRIAKASLEYDLPALNRFQEKVETNIVVEYTADDQRARERSGDVRRVLTRAEVQRQVLFLQTKIDLLRRGNAAEQDRTVVANLLKTLIHKFDEFGDRPTANQYRQMQEEFLAQGTISQDMLNRSLAASSVVEEMVMAQDIDF